VILWGGLFSRRNEKGTLALRWGEGGEPVFQPKKPIAVWPGKKKRELSWGKLKPGAMTR